MKFLSGLIFVLIAEILPLAGQIPDSVKYISLDPHGFYQQYFRTDSSLLIDVREPFEYKSKRIKNSTNIPASGNIDRAADTINKKLSLFLYCTSGFRSSRAAVKLYEKGFRKLYSLKGGITAWRKDGMPVVRGSRRRAKG
jgi:rhodanese-related sulfurtransferase